MGTPVATETLVNRCPATSIQSFPLGCESRPTEQQYETVYDPSISPLDFTWATEQVDLINNTSKTFIHWRNNKYTNVSVQITRNQHSGWLTDPTRATQNTADFVMVFQSASDVISYRYIVLIVPLISITQSPTGAPRFLLHLQDPSRTEKYTLRTMFPEESTTMFANYTTCLRGYSSMKTPEYVTVFLSVEGLEVSSELMGQIKSSRNVQNFPTFAAPFMTRIDATTTTSVTAGTTGKPFIQYIQTTDQLLNYTNAGKQYVDASRIVREDSLDAYQCVPLDPDQNIQDGKIKVDLETGEVLSDVIAERAAVRAADSTKGSMEPGRLEKYMGTAIGIVLAVIFFSLIVYFLWNWIRTATGNAAVPAVTALGVGAASAGISESWAQSIPKYGLLILVGGFGGFLIGAMLS